MTINSRLKARGVSGELEDPCELEDSEDLVKPIFSVNSEYVILSAISLLFTLLSYTKKETLPLIFNKTKHFRLHHYELSVLI